MSNKNTEKRKHRHVKDSVSYATLHHKTHFHEKPLFPNIHIRERGTYLLYNKPLSINHNANEWLSVSHRPNPINTPPNKRKKRKINEYD